jgi:hypothetical protein
MVRRKTARVSERNTQHLARVSERNTQHLGRKHKKTTAKQAGKGAGMTAVKRRLPPRSKVIYKAVPQGYVFVQNGSGLWSKVRKGLARGVSKVGNFLKSGAGRSAVKGTLGLIAEHGPAKYRESAKGTLGVLEQVGYGGRPVISTMPAGCCMVQRGDGFFDFLKKIPKAIVSGAKATGRFLKSDTGRALVHTGLQTAQQLGGPRVKVGAGLAEGVLNQAGYGYSYVPSSGIHMNVLRRVR